MDDRKLVEQEQKDELTHYGTPRHSGRYPWGSGENPYQRNGNFVAHVTKLRKEGLSEVEIAKSMEMSTSQLRARMSIAKSEIRKEESAMAWKLKEKGYSNVAIGQRLGKNESSVRALLDPHLKARNDMTNDLAEQLKIAVKEQKYIDVGAGSEYYFNMPVSNTRMKTAIALLKEQGYKIQYVQVQQMGTNEKTTLKVLKELGFAWVTDGYTDHVYQRYGLVFIPCTVSKPIVVPKDRVNTVCYHPNMMTEEEFTELDGFLQEHGKECMSFDQYLQQLEDQKIPEWNLRLALEQQKNMVLRRIKHLVARNALCQAYFQHRQRQRAN